MKKLLVALALFALLAGCASVSKVEGEQVVNNRMLVKVTDAWNKVNIPGSKQPYEMWTQEGIPLDHLRFWAAIQPGQPMMVAPTSSAGSGQKPARVPTFAANMAPDQLVNLFETLYAADGSLVKMTKVEPAPFAGEQGLRFEFSVSRKSDDVQMLGVGWVSVRKNELFAATFVAPRLAFYPRLLPKAEAVVRTAAIKG